MKLLAKRLTTLLLVFAMPILAFAQQKTISGKVTSDKGGPVSGASVVAKGSRTGTKTSSDGTYSLSVPNATTSVVISSVGYEAQTVAVDAANNADAVLKTSNEVQTEVVVVGYGTARKKDLTGSVASLSTKDFNKGIISTPEQLFAGRTPGITVTPSSGEPGAASTIIIRGTASIRGNQDPLYVVDGVPLEGGSTAGTSSGIEGSSTPKNPLLFLNPNDIESISILKDASSAAIYGTRGANGVIIITTKNGKGAKGSFTFGSNTSISTTASRYDLLNPSEFLALAKKANVDAGTSLADASAAVLNLDKGSSTDWQKEIFRTGYSQNYNLGWGFSKNGTSLRLSGSIDDQKGIVKTSGLNRKTVRANFTQSLLPNDRLKLGATLSYSNIKNRYAPNTNNAGYQGSLIGAALRFNPTYPVKNPNGTYYDPGDGSRNPTEMLEYFDDRDVINRTLANINASYKIINALTFKVTLGYDKSKGVRTSFADPRLVGNAYSGTTNVFGVDYANPIAVNGRGVRNNSSTNSTLFESTLSYDKVFNDKHVVNVIGGFSYQNQIGNGDGTVAWKLNTPVTNAGDVFIKDMNNFVNSKAAFIPYYYKTELQSYFARANYTFDNRFFLTGTVRIDGSSKFGPNNKYGTFPALAAKWKLSNEKFAASSINKLLGDLSLRVNIGKLGSQDGLGAYDAVDLQTSYLGNSGAVESVLVHQGNKNLKWEEATTSGIGIDFSTKGGRLSGTVDYFSTKRKNLLFFGPVPGGFSATSYYFGNLPGYVLNKGLEVSLNYQLVKGKKFGWDVSYNMTFLKNKLADTKYNLNTGAVSGQGLSGAYAQILKDGYSLFTFKMPVFQGFDGNGDARYTQGAADQLLGSALPKFTAGLTNNFRYANWNASIFFNAGTGFYVYNNTANALFLKGSLKNGGNVTKSVGYSNEDPINPGSVSSRFLEKGDFLRLSNALVSYNFNLKSKKIIKTIAISVSGQNLALFTNYSGLDPEVNVDKNINGAPSRGFDYAGYPKARTVTFGLNIGF